MNSARAEFNVAECVFLSISALVPSSGVIVLGRSAAGTSGSFWLEMEVLRGVVSPVAPSNTPPAMELARSG
jgi:hypothetical protein